MAAAAVKVASGKQQVMAAEESGGDVRGEAAGGEQPWKKFVYVEPSRRVKEILKEELNFQKEACHLKHPAAVVNCLETVCSVRKNVAFGSLKLASQNRNCSLLQPRFYSRHAGLKSNDLAFPTLTNSSVWKSPPSNTPSEKRPMTKKSQSKENS